MGGEGHEAGRASPSPAAEVWLVALSACASALAAIERTTPRLSADDERRISGINDSIERERRRSAHIALRVLIERAWGPAWRAIAFDIADSGRPSLSGAPGSFSLSHAEDLALIGLAPEGMIGVDIECARSVNLSEERRARVESAAARLVSDKPLPTAPAARILQAWVRLEALAKADGSGIGRTLTRFGASGHRGSEPAPPDPALTVRVYDVDAGPEIYAAVAVGRSVPAPVLHRFPATVAAIEALITGAARRNGP